MEFITTPLGYVMRFCYNLLSNYGLAIILFTFFTKIILFPISLWTHKNSIKLVRIQPELNFIKAKYFGDKDKISDEQLALYKREKYHSLAGMVPMILQLALLMLVIEIIYNPLTYVLHYDSNSISQIVTSACSAFGLDAESNSVQLAAVREIQNGFDIAGVDLTGIKALDMNFLCFDLSALPFKAKGVMLLVPLLAGFSALSLSLFQNKMNPLQAEQNKFEQIFTAAISIGISLILGGFVPAGIGFYWIFSNIFAMLQQVVLNAVISPKKNIDYDALEKSKEELEKLKSVSRHNSPKPGEESYKREKADYKRFFSVANKHFVIYAEGGGYYKYFAELVEYILKNSNIVIHYVTGDPNDNIFNIAKENSRVKAYFIGEKRLISLFMKMDADIVVMSTPDLENYHLKRSYLKKDIEYIYLVHGPMSTHMVMNKGCLDHFDTIFCVGDFQIPEIRKQEEIYNLPAKNLVVCGYGFLERLQRSYDAQRGSENEIKKILIAPSWQEQNILDSCIDLLLKELLGKGYNVVIRPHPEYVKRYRPRLEKIMERYEGYGGNDLTFELDFSDSRSLYNSDIVITDWSSTVFEFSYVTLKPCIFIDTPPKIYNADYKEIGIEPLEIQLRNIIGKSFPMDDMSGLADTVRNMLDDRASYAKIIEDARNKYVANYGNSGEVAGKYVIKQLIEKQRSQDNNS